MKRTFLLLLSALLPLLASAYDAEIDGIYYNFSGDEATVTYRDYYGTYSGNVVIPESVTFNDKTYSVTSIGFQAFYYCSRLTSITIPNSVTSIGNDAFQGCSGLTSITIPNSVTSIGSSAFYGCSGLTSITIPNNVTSIGYQAFYNCSGLTSVIINCPNVGSWFSGLTSIQEVALGETVTSIGRSAFSGCSGLTSITIPNSVTSIGDWAFSYCSGLTSITIPNSVTSIGGDAFAGTAWYESLPDGVVYIGTIAYKYKGTIPQGVQISVTLKEGTTAIAGSAFSDCSGLTSITIPNSVTSIGGYAFYGCSGLTSITIPEGVTSIGDSAFSGCSGLTSVHITDVLSWCNIAFGTSSSNPLANANHLYMNGEEINDLVIPSTVTSIGDYAFYGCSGLTSVTIPNSVTSIDSYAFSGCSGLTSVTIPNSVTAIGDHAFEGCSGLTSVTIPNSVTSIGGSAFSYCSGLTSVTIPEGVTSIGERAFRDCTSLTSITIPNSVTSIGESAFWGCLLRNVFVKCLTPPITRNDTDADKSSIFSPATCHHATLYVPTGCWDAYAFGAGWFWFNNIRETAVAEEEVSMQQAYTLMDAGTFAYSVYDPVNDRIGTINSAGGINEDNPNHSWQVIEADGWHYLYNIGARKYVRREGDRLELTDTLEPIELADSDNGLILGGQTEKPCVLVSNERMSVAQSAIDVVTSIKNLNNSPMANGQPFFNLAGQRIKTPQHGINIIGNRKVLVK